MPITAKSFRVFSAVEALREGHADVRQALLPLFKPDLCKFSDEVFNPSKVASEINKEYRLDITPEIVAEMAPLFESEGWLELIPTATDVAYRVTCVEAAESGLEETQFDAKARALGAEFHAFIVELSPLKEVEKSEPELVDDLIDWLLSVEAYAADSLKTIRKVEYEGSKLVYRTVVIDEKSLSRSEYLCARFVEKLVSINSEFIPFLTELASVGLITDVVRDFQKPTGVVKATSLAVYLDSPVAIDYVGLSGRAAQDSIRNILTKITLIGGSVRMFRISIEEMQNSLRAILFRSPADRDGPTAQAMRRGEVAEAFVRQIAHSPDGVLKTLNIAVLDQSEAAYPNEHKFFTGRDIKDLYADIHWVEDDTPRYHDALAAGLIMRKRNGTRSNDLFDVKHVLLTENPHFAPVTRRVAREKNYIGPVHIGPVVHQRQLATAVWLRAGLGVSDQETPRRFILSACSRVLNIRRNIMERVRQEAQSLQNVSAEQIEMLLAEGRSSQILMDKTLGSANVINSSNIERLIGEMKEAVAAEAVAPVQRAADEAARESQVLKSQLADEMNKSERIANALLSTVNYRARRRRFGITALGAVIFIAAESLPLMWGQPGVIITAALLLITICLHFAGALGKYVFDPLNSLLDRRSLQKQMNYMGLTLSDLPFVIEYSEGAFRSLDGGQSNA